MIYIAAMRSSRTWSYRMLIQFDLCISIFPDFWQVSGIVRTAVTDIHLSDGRDVHKDERVIVCVAEANLDVHFDFKPTLDICWSLCCPAGNDLWIGPRLWPTSWECWHPWCSTPWVRSMTFMTGEEANEVLVCPRQAPVRAVLRECMYFWFARAFARLIVFSLDSRSGARYNLQS